MVSHLSNHSSESIHIGKSFHHYSPNQDFFLKTESKHLPYRLFSSICFCRCTALVLSVSHLVLVTKHACKLSENMDWIDQSLADVEDHLKVSTIFTLNS